MLTGRAWKLAPQREARAVVASRICFGSNAAEDAFKCVKNTEGHHLGRRGLTLFFGRYVDPSAALCAEFLDKVLDLDVG